MVIRVFLPAGFVGATHNNSFPNSVNATLFSRGFGTGSSGVDASLLALPGFVRSRYRNSAKSFRTCST